MTNNDREQIIDDLTKEVTATERAVLRAHEGIKHMVNLAAEADNASFNGQLAEAKEAWNQFDAMAEATNAALGVSTQDSERLTWILGPGSKWFTDLIEAHDGCHVVTREEIDAAMEKELATMLIDVLQRMKKVVDESK